MSIYHLMREDWKVYCLMCSILYIEEMSKPTAYTTIKRYKDKQYRCLCFHSLRLKMKDPEVVGKLFKITKYWETKKGIPLIGKSFKKVRKENSSGQDLFFFTPLWLNLILNECGRIPNKYSFETALRRINNLKQYPILPINKLKSLFSFLLCDKKLAAGAFILSMDLECRGIQSGNVALCMSAKFKDFLQFMLGVAQKHDWTSNQQLSPVKVGYSLNLGINATPQYEFRITIKGLREIYKLAGPLINSHKNKCISFHVRRSKNYVNLGGKLRKNNTRGKILSALRKTQDLTTTSLQFDTGVRTDVVWGHLHRLESEGRVLKVRNGKRYFWNLRTL